MNEEKSHRKWLQERELKLQELNRLLRSPAKISTTSEVLDGDVTSSIPPITDQLSIDVSTEEVKEPSATVSSDAKHATTPLATAPTPSSPLLTSLLRSPTASASPQNANKGFSSPPKTFNLGNQNLRYFIL